MTRTYALLMLLDLGPLSRKEIRDITGWPESRLKHILSGCSANGTIESRDGIWYRSRDGVLTESTL
jgi:hypothetical protein